MGIIDKFNHFAADFEICVKDDDWSRLAKYFTDDASYENIGDPEPMSKGREAILAFFKKDVSENDRQFDSRTLVGLTPPSAEGDRLSRQWRCTYTLAGAPDLVVEGESRYLFEGDLIKEIKVEFPPSTMQSLNEWMQKYGVKLQNEQNTQ